MTNGFKATLDAVRFGLVFWMLAGLRAPGLGTTAAAEESLRWLAIPSSRALVLGGLLTLALVLSDLFLARSRPGRDALGEPTV